MGGGGGEIREGRRGKPKGKERGRRGGSRREGEGVGEKGRGEGG